MQKRTVPAAMNDPAVEPNNRLLIILVCLSIVFGVWFVFFRGGSSSTPAGPRSAQSYVAEFGGDVGKYQAILQWSDCHALNQAFQAGKANFDNHAPGGGDLWRGQMEVTDDRMTALACP